MSKERRATFSKAIIENGDDPRTVYSFQLEKMHWIAGAVVALIAVLGFAITVRGAVYDSVQDIAAQEFRAQLDEFHEQAQPAIKELIDQRIRVAQYSQTAVCQRTQYEENLERAGELRTIAETLARLDERLENIEDRLGRLEH